MEFLNMFLALAFVVGLIFALQYVVRKTNLHKVIGGIKSSGGRIQIVDRIFLDAKSSVILLEKDGQEYLVFSGANGATLLDKNAAKKK